MDRDLVEAKRIEDRPISRCAGREGLIEALALVVRTITMASTRVRYLLTTLHVTQASLRNFPTALST